MRLMVRGWLLAVVCAGLAACGGGGGSSRPTLSLSTHSVNVSASTDDSAPSATFSLHVENVSDETEFYGYVDYLGTAISTLDTYATGDYDGVVELAMIPPSSLEPGTYTDTVTVEFCEDEACQRPFKGSPATVAVTYTVTEGTRPKPAISTPSDQLTATAEINQSGGSATLPITITNPPDSWLSISATATTEGISYVNVSSSSSTSAELFVGFKYGLAEGSYHDTVTITACYDYSCTRQAQGSPKQIAVTYTITPRQPAAPDRALLPTSSVQALPHDVIDAEFSASLNAVVMVASQPGNALYLYSLADGTEQKLVLDKSPTSVSVSPDGKAAAIGHDALITYVNLSQLATPATAKKLLNVSTKVFDLVLDGNGWVDAFPAADQWVQIHAVNVATNTETLVGNSISAGTRAKLHPDGKSFYSTDYDGLDKYDVTAGVPSYLYSSSYYSNYYVCSDLWISEEGNNIYTACGNVFQSTSTQSSDMLYAGSIALTAPSPNNSNYYYSNYRIGALSQSAEKKEIALIERDLNCESDPYLCRDYYDLFESQFLNRTATYSIPPMTVDGRNYVQRGLFTFHSGDGNKRVMISKLLNISDTAKTYYLSTLN